MGTTTMTVEVPILAALEDLRRLANFEHLAYKLYWQKQIDNEDLFVEKLIQPDTDSKEQWHSVICREQVSNYCIYRFKPQPVMVDLDFSDQLAGEIAASKFSCARFVISSQEYEQVFIAKCGWKSYSELREGFVRLDGSKFEKEAV